MYTLSVTQYNVQLLSILPTSPLALLKYLSGASSIGSFTGMSLLSGKNLLSETWWAENQTNDILALLQICWYEI